MAGNILSVRNLEKRFVKRALLGGSSDNVVNAVDDISFYVGENETLGLVGESGCGKTTTGKAILKLVPVTGGEIRYKDTDITHLKEKEFRPYRRNIQMIFQDLDAALNPKMKIRDILKEAVKLHHAEMDEDQLEQKVRQLLELVNLKHTKLNNRPGELSGGEKRRVGIARVLAVDPSFIVADEPTSALDVSIQAQVINLMRDLQNELGLSYLFISHDLPLVEIISHRIAVMYQGRIVETGPAETLARDPKHPYTKMLWSSLHHDADTRFDIESVRALDVDRPRGGCRFAPRCPVYLDNGRPEKCTSSAEEPRLPDTVNGEHVVACHFPL